MASTGLNDAVLEEIRVWMARRRLNQSELAELLGEGQPWVSRRLGGRTPLTVDDLQRVADALGVDVLALLPRKDSNLQPAGFWPLGYWPEASNRAA
jgi:transcriptional regulator with XRE-family HTH domain